MFTLMKPSLHIMTHRYPGVTMVSICFMKRNKSQSFVSQTFESDITK